MILSLQESIEAIKIHLFNHNYVDRKIISSIKRNTTHIEKDGCLVVSTDDIKNLLNTKFNKEVRAFRNQPSATAYHTANSLFFLTRLIETFNNLKYFEIYVSNNKSYSRVKKDFNIMFDYRILQLKVDLTEFNSFYIDSFLKEIGYNSGIQINNLEFEMQELSAKIDSYFYINDEDFGDYQSLIDNLDFVLDETVIEDNPKIILKLY